MKALLCKTLGMPDQLVVEEIPDPVPGPGQVLLEMKAAGVNFPDVLIIQNKYQFKPPLPFSPGSELAGVVKAVGEGVTNVKPGDAVIAFTAFGAFAEEVMTDGKLRMLPAARASSFDDAASFILTYGTSDHALRTAAQLQGRRDAAGAGRRGRRRARRDRDRQGARRARDRLRLERREARGVPRARRRRTSSTTQPRTCASGSRTSPAARAWT